MKEKEFFGYRFFFHFFDVPIYDREICIIVGLNHKEAVKEAKKQKCTKDFLEALNEEEVKEQCEDVADLKSRVQGAARRQYPENYFLFLKPYKNNWLYLDTLNHECFHLIQFMGHMVHFWDDTEPPAYLHTWVFKKLRRILSGVEK